MLSKEQLEASPVKRADAIAQGLMAYNKFKSKVIRDDYIVIINMREPSYRKRMYVINNKNEIVGEHHVAHGSGSADTHDRAYAVSFSNEANSHKSSLGAMITGTVYQGKHGKSLKLQGLEKGINDNVEKRYIVIHAANYVTDGYIRSAGRAGCSWGCPAIDPAISSGLIDKIKGGCFVYIHY